MKKAIDYLKTLGIKCDKEGNILSKLPDGEKGIELVNMLEDATNCVFTIIGNTIVENDIMEPEEMEDYLSFRESATKKGRPTVEESTKSCTVSLRPTEKVKLEKKFGSLTAAIKTLLK